MVDEGSKSTRMDSCRQGAACDSREDMLNLLMQACLVTCASLSRSSRSAICIGPNKGAWALQVSDAVLESLRLVRQYNVSSLSALFSLQRALQLLPDVIFHLFNQRARYLLLRHSLQGTRYGFFVADLSKVGLDTTLTWTLLGMRVPKKGTLWDSAFHKPLPVKNAAAQPKATLLATVSKQVSGRHLPSSLV